MIWKALLQFFLSVDMFIYPNVLFWVCSADVHNDVVSSMMSRNRFNEIMKYLHLANNTYLDPNDKFSKVGPLLDKLNKQCLLNHLSEQRASIDESMVPYFRRHECKQFMKNKPVNLDTNFGLLQVHSDMPFNFIFTCVKTTSLIQIWGLEDLQLTSSWSVCQKNAGSSCQREEREREREGERKREKEGDRGRGGERGKRERGRDRERGRVGENAPLKPTKDMKKLESGSTDVWIDDNAKIALVRCKDNKVVTVLSSNYGLNPTAKTKWYIKERKVESILSNLNAIKKQHRNGRGWLFGSKHSHVYDCV